eukprot:5619178-Prymnesium_polylepis.1
MAHNACCTPLDPFAGRLLKKYSCPLPASRRPRLCAQHALLLQDPPPPHPSPLLSARVAAAPTGRCAPPRAGRPSSLAACRARRA